MPDGVSKKSVPEIDDDQIKFLVAVSVCVVVIVVQIGFAFL